MFIVIYGKTVALLRVREGVTIIAILSKFLARFVIKEDVG
ncbi:hypothetical protein Psal006b_03490 (plasmid) [Piscirickettsia salmonis]|nr:hypothetical protein Psal006b_03490 [Piscirickettsia salmonis]